MLFTTDVIILADTTDRSRETICGYF